MATLCVMVWVMAACGPLLPATPLQTPAATDPTLIVRTPESSPGTVTRAAAVQSQPAATQEASRPGQSPVHQPESSPTPIYYTVVAGDTLPRIAARFGTSAAAIRAANGDLPADRLYPGQVLLIPARTAARETSTLVRYLPSDTPPPLELAAPACTRSPAAEVICLGTIHNPYDYPLTNLAVRVTLLDADGTPGPQRAISVPQQVLLPGQVTGYTALFPGAPEDARPSAALLSADPLDANAAAPLPLSVEDVTFAIEGGLVRVEAALTHSGPSAVQEIMLLALLFDADDRLTGLRVERPDLILLPGESAPVTLLVTPLAAGTVRVALAAEAGMVAGIAAATDTQAVIPTAGR